MIAQHCLGPDIDRSRISGDATITGASYLTGGRTTVAAGAVIHDSRLHDAVVEAGASVIDSILVAEGHGHQHRCDAAGRTVVIAPDQPRVGAGARVSGSTLIDTAVGRETVVSDTWAQDCVTGERCRITAAKLIISELAAHVTVTGPTEVSEAFLGHHTTIDRRGYYEGIFSNRFHRLRFDAAAGRLRVIETIDLPHVSRYGVNTINSTNSGKLLPRGGAPLTSFGPPAGLWQDRLLSHEQIELAPCCFVVPWTKVIGQSPLPHPTDDDLVNDEFTTYLMPFSMAGVGGDLTRGLVMPGELSVGLGTKQRRGAWVFTYAPEAVINMVARLHEALPPERRGVADTVVLQAMETAIEMTKALAQRNRVDLAVPVERQRVGWPRWIAATWRLLRVHAEAGLWTFREGRPIGWRREQGRWTHPNIGALLAVAPDALQNQKSEAELYAFADPVPAIRSAGLWPAVPRASRPRAKDDAGGETPPGSAKGGAGRRRYGWDVVESGAAGAAIIDPSAQVAADAVILPGSRIGKGAVVQSRAVIWNSVVEGTTIGPGARIERSVLRAGAVGEGTLVRSSILERADIGAASNVQCASIVDSQLAAQATVSAFADVRDTRSAFGTILGGAVHGAQIDTYLMSMHMAGGCFYPKSLPLLVEVDGTTIAVPAVPMLGGGSLIRGTADRPVTAQACFVGSNAIIEPNTHLGLGCFVLGHLGPDQGLLPFTISTDDDVAHHQIGAVLAALPSTVITHFIGWTYNATGAEYGPAVAQMVRAAVEEGAAAIEWEFARRSGAAAPNARFACYCSLPHYSADQLQAGLDEYRWARTSGAWDLSSTAGELRFTSPLGQWLERNGSALWTKA